MESTAIISSNRHQLEKALSILKNLNHKSKIFYIGIKQPGLKLNEEDWIKNIEHKFPEKNDLKNFSNLFVFTAHANKKNLNLFNLAVNLGIKIICFQESHQLSIQNGNIFNIVLPVNLVVCASNLEKELIFQKKFINKELLLCTGWMFQNEGSKDNKNIKKDVIIFCAASSSLASTSKENEYSIYKLLDYIQNKHKGYKIAIKPHPQERKVIKKSLAKKKLINIEIIDNDEPPEKLAKDFEIIYSSDKSQTMLDLIQLNRKFYVYSVGKPNIYFEALPSIEEIIEEDIQIKKFDQSNANLDIYRDALNKPSKNLTEVLNNIIMQTYPNNSHLNELLAWEKLILINNAEFQKDLSAKLKTTNFSLNQRMFEANNISQQSRLFIEFILRTRYVSIDIQYHKSFLDSIYKPYLIENFPYHALFYFLMIENNLEKLELSQSILEIIENIYLSLIKKILPNKLALLFDFKERRKTVPLFNKILISVIWKKIVNFDQ